MFSQNIHNISDQIFTTVGYFSDDVVVILEIQSTDDVVNSMTAINTGHYNTIELSNNEHTILLESNKSPRFMPFNTNAIVICFLVELKSSIEYHK